MAYTVIEAAAGTPSAGDILADGIPGDPSQEKTYCADGLETETEYIIAAAASNEGGTSEVATVRTSTGSTPSAVLEQEKEFTFLTASFSITPSKAERAAYMLLEKDRAVPSAQEILEGGIRVGTDGTETIELLKLKPETGYIIAAAAENEYACSEVSILELEKMPEPVYESTVNCTYAAGSYYGDMYNDKGTGEFFLVLTDVEFVNDYAVSAGTILQLDTYSQLAGVKVGAEPLNGIYRFITPVPGEEPGSYVDACTEYSIGGLNSIWRETDGQGLVKNYGLLTGAVLEYLITDGSYRIVAYATYSDGRNVKLTYEGECRFRNTVPSDLRDIDVTGFGSAEAVYYGQKNSFGSDQFSVRLQDTAEDPQQKVILEFYVPVCSDPGNPEVPSGTFAKGEWLATEPWTYYVGEEAMGGIHIYGSYTESVIDEVLTRGFVRDGSFAVRNNGDGTYAFDLDLVITDEGNYSGNGLRNVANATGEEPLRRTVKGGFTARMPIKNEYPIPPGDLSINADRVYKATFDPQASGAGGYNYHIELLDTAFDTGENFGPISGGTGNHVVLDLWGTEPADPAAPAVPEGTYYMDYSSMPGTCHGQYTYVQHFDKNGNLLPLNFWNATVTVTREGNGYGLSFSGQDNRNEKIDCNYAGPIEFTVQTGSSSLYDRPSYADIEEKASEPERNRTAFENAFRGLRPKTENQHGRPVRLSRAAGR